MIFCSLVIVGVLSKRRGRALRTPTTPRPASASASAMTPTVRLSLNYCTIADFRGDNCGAFKSVFRQFVLLCRRLDL